MIKIQQIKSKNLEITSFVFLLLYPQINYHFGVMTTILVPISILFLFLTFLKRINNKKNITLSPIIILPLLFLFLSLIMFFFGEPGQLKPRPLYLFSALQIISIYSLIRLKENAICLKHCFLASLSIELITVIGQFTYISYGIGFEPKHELDFTGIGGTLLNPNNSSIHILCTYIAYKHLSENLKFKVLNLLVTISTLAGILITLSRTALILFLIHFVFLNKNSIKKINLSRIFILITLPILLIIAYNTKTLHDSEIGSRAIDRIESIQHLTNDESASFRAESLNALAKNIFNLGTGSFSDLNYQKYFDSNADALIKINPHSFITETSFLFGYIGLFYSIGLMISIIKIITANNSYTLGEKIFISVTMIISTSIPSSILINYVFFLPFIGLAIQKNQIRNQQATT